LDGLVLATCCHTLVLSVHPWLLGCQSFGEELKAAVLALVTSTSIASNTDTFACLASVAAQVMTLVASQGAGVSCTAPVAAAGASVDLQAVLCRLESTDHPVRRLLFRRAMVSECRVYGGAAFFC
jgi:hypothetical protein